MANSGTDRFAGPSGHKQTSFARRNRSKTSPSWIGGPDHHGRDLPETCRQCTSTPNAPESWGIRALMGRWLIPRTRHRDNATAVVVLTYHFWQRYYLGDPNVIGAPFSLSTSPYQIVA